MLRTLFMIYLMTVLGLAMAGNLLRAKKDPVAAVVSAMLNIPMLVGIRYIANTPE